jgi:hypothetical protein
MRAFIQFQKKRKKEKETLSYRKLCCLLFVQTTFIILSTQVTIYIAAQLCRQLQDVAYSNDLQQGDSYAGSSTWRMWFKLTAVSVGFLVR